MALLGLVGHKSVGGGRSGHSLPLVVEGKAEVGQSWDTTPSYRRGAAYKREKTRKEFSIVRLSCQTTLYVPDGVNSHQKQAH